MDFPVALQIPELRPKSQTMRGILSELVDNMTGQVESGILDAEELPAGPETFEGIQPFTYKVGNVTLQGTPTDDRLHTFQNKTGVVALLDDAYGVRPTVILPEGLVSVDWDVSDNFLVVLDGRRQSTFYMTHSKAGMEIDLLLVNNGTNQTVYAWDSAIKWPAATPPTMPAALSGTSALLLVTIENINGIMYGEYLNYSAGAPIIGGGGGLGKKGGGDSTS
jgi:hypothetical protein